MGYHGKPDWGLQLKKTTYTFDDLSELAVRLGSISQFDRRGEILFADGFEHGLNKYWSDGSGKDNRVEIVNDQVKSGGYSLKMITGSTSQSSCSIGHYEPYPVKSKMGCEISFALTEGISHFQIRLNFFAEDKFKFTRIDYDYSEQRLYYYDKNGEWQVLAEDVYVERTETVFNIIKLVVDFENNKYSRFILNNKTYSMENIDIRAITSGDERHLAISFHVWGEADYNRYAYVDNIIITQNEP